MTILNLLQDKTNNDNNNLLKYSRGNYNAMNQNYVLTSTLVKVHDTGMLNINMYVI